MQAGVGSAHTAFIAVHKGSGEAVQGPLLRRRVPAPGQCCFIEIICYHCAFALSSNTSCATHRELGVLFLCAPV